MDLTNSWANRYQRHLDALRPGSLVHNLAVPGYSTFSALPTGTPISTAIRPNTGFPDPLANITYALTFAPDVIIVSFPSGGDFTMGTTVAQIMANIATMQMLAQAAGAQVWVTTSKPVTDTTQVPIMLTYNADVLSTYGSHGIDFWTPMANPDGSSIAAYALTDNVHPNAEGHRILFEQVVAAGIPSAF